MPYGKWPSGYSLRSMQQLAVNIAMNEEEYTPVFSVMDLREQEKRHC